MLLCLPLLAPWLVQRLTGRVRVPDFGFRYGVRSLGATLANTSFSVSSLAMAVCLLVGITLLVESFRETLVRWVDRSLRADVYVTATVAARPGPGATLERRGSWSGWRGCRTWKASILCAGCSCAWAAGAWRWWRWT